MPRVQVHAPQDLVAGASLLAVSSFALWAAGPLATGRLGAPGPGLVPRVLALAARGLGALARRPRLPPRRRAARPVAAARAAPHRADDLRHCLAVRRPRLRGAGDGAVRVRRGDAQPDGGPGPGRGSRRIGQLLPSAADLRSRCCPSSAGRSSARSWGSSPGRSPGGTRCSRARALPRRRNSRWAPPTACRPDPFSTPESRCTCAAVSRMPGSSSRVAQASPSRLPRPRFDERLSRIGRCSNEYLLSNRSSLGDTANTAFAWVICVRAVELASLPSG